MRIAFQLNGKDVSVDCAPYTRLIHLLREEFGLLGMKEGCLQGQCGYCLVILNDELVPACLVPAFSAFRGRIVTIEGFRETPEYHDIEKGFLQAGAVPCGFCASAKVLAAHILLQENPNPSEAVIRKALSGILCRCTSPTDLIAAVMAAASNRRLRSHGQKI
jgi:carbon-monoxide dehydrogenase small subunit